MLPTLPVDNFWPGFDNDLQYNFISSPPARLPLQHPGTGRGGGGGGGEGRVRGRGGGGAHQVAGVLVQGRQLGGLCRQVISFLIVVDEIHSSKYAKIFDNENLSILMTATYPDGWRWRYHGMPSRVTFKGYKSPAKSV